MPIDTSLLSVKSFLHGSKREAGKHNCFLYQKPIKEKENTDNIQFLKSSDFTRTHDRRNKIMWPRLKKQKNWSDEQRFQEVLGVGGSRDFKQLF